MAEQKLAVRRIFVISIIVIAIIGGTASLLIVIHAVVGVQSETSHPKIELLEPKVFDFGKISEGEKVSHKFRFSNTGDAYLEIYQVKSSCRCTASLLSDKIIEPGAIGELQMTFYSAGYTGKIVRTASIYSNDPKTKKAKVTLTGYVERKTKLTTSATLEGYQHLTILYTGDEHGRVEPCGCAEGQLGGFTRQATLIESERESTSGGFLLLGVGNTFGEDESYYRLRAELAVSAMSKMGYDAFALGESEFAFGKPFIHKWMKEVEFPTIAANITDKSTGVLFASAPYILKDIGGIKVGIIGVINGSYLPDERWGELGLRVSDHREAVKKTLAEIRSTSDLVIVLGQLGLAKAAVLAQTVRGIDLIITGHVKQKITKPFRAGRTYIVSNSDKGQSIGQLKIWLDEKKKIVGIEGSVIPITDSVAVHPKIAELVSEYKTKLKELPIKSINEIQEKYVTSESCRKCHEDAYKVWKNSKHAFAFQTLKSRDNHYDPECLKCHTTGYWLSTGFLRIDETPQHKDVQCEACHGPGETHTEKPTEAYGGGQAKSSCSACHTPEQSPGFRYSEYWRVIRHEQP